MRKKEKNNLSKYRKRRNFNIATIIVLFLVLYLLAEFIYSRSKTKITMYEVVEENLYQDLTVEGVIVRDETVFYTQDSGFINYYIPEGQRASRQSTIYSVDANRAVYDTLGLTGEISLTEDNILEIKRMIASFMNQFDASDYSSVYTMKNQLASTIQVLADSQLLSRIENYIKENGTGNSFSFSFVTTEHAGVVSYISDSLDGLTADMVTTATFQDEDFSKTSLRRTGSYAAGDPVYKLITSNNWQIVCPISTELFSQLSDKTNLRFRIEKDDSLFTAPVSFEMRGNECYMYISMTKSVQSYMNDRFLKLDIILNEEKGLKIPTSAVVKKDFYLISPAYLTYGGDSNERGVIVAEYDPKTGVPNYVFKTVTIYREDEDLVYIAKEDFPSGTLIYSEKLEEPAVLSLVGTLEGVYNVNRGYHDFRRIEQISRNEDYIIVKKGTTNGIAKYDHIALDGSLVKGEHIIY